MQMPHSFVSAFLVAFGSVAALLMIVVYVCVNYEFNVLLGHACIFL
jgi:hypothetical protein